MSAHQGALNHRDYSVIPLQNGDLVYHGSKGKYIYFTHLFILQES